MNIPEDTAARAAARGPAGFVEGDRGSPQRDVTTVQRWEKREGMPVLRHLHDRMGSVYASRVRIGCLVRAAGICEQCPEMGTVSLRQIPLDLRRGR